MNAKASRTAALGTPTDLKHNAVGDISGALRILLADVFALYLKTKNFHWHMSGPHFRDYHLLLDEQADQIFAHDRRHRRACAQDRRHHDPLDRPDQPSSSASWTTMPNSSRRSTCWPSCATTISSSTAHMRETHDLCDEHGDVATASLLENWIDEAERRTWFLFEACRTEQE